MFIQYLYTSFTASKIAEKSLKSQSGNQKPLIEEEQTVQGLNEERQKDKQ
jgi:hypothetical protein